MERILVAVDMTDNARTVVEEAVAVARATGAKIRFVHVVQPPVVPPPPSTLLLSLPSTTKELVAAAEAWLARLLAEVPDPLGDDVAVEVGSTVPAVCRAARSYDADLVVIGAHEHGRFARMLGTTAAAIANRLDRPLLVVRPGASLGRGSVA